MNDLISVIVPAYNAEAFIDRCLNSLLRQTYENLEIICINDASTDNTAQTVRKINDPRIRLINNEQNLRAAVANDAEVVTAATSVEWPDKTKIWAGRPGVCTGFADKLKAVRNGSCWNKLYQTGFLRKHKLEFPAGLIAEDNFFIIRCLHCCARLAVIDDTRYHYIMMPSSLTHDPQKAEKRKNDSLTISRMIVEFIEQNAPEHKKAAVAFIIKNVVAAQYFADNGYYRQFKAFAGFSGMLFKARFKALRRKWTGKIK